MKRLSIHVVALTAAISLAGCAPPADERPPMTETAPGIGVTDPAAVDTRETQEFVQRATEKNVAEIQLGKLAQERASNPQVRQYAQRMVEEHTKSLEELRQIAQRENIQIDERMSDEGRRVQERLQGLKGAEFDREYMSAMVESHEEMQRLVENRADRVAEPRAPADRQPVGTVGEEPRERIDQELNQWASRKLPVVERHLQQAEELHAKLAKTGGAAGR